MAVKTFYWLPDNTAAGSTSMGSLQDGGSAPSPVNSNSQWKVGTRAATVYAKYWRNTQRQSTDFGVPAEPTGSFDVTHGDCLRSQNAYTGTFAAGNWTCKSTLALGGSATGGTVALRYRLYRSSDPDGASAVEITSGVVQQANDSVAIGGGVTQTSTFNPGAVTLTNEYLFLEVALIINGTANNANCTWIIQVGSAIGELDSTDFQPPAYPYPPRQRIKRNRRRHPLPRGKRRDKLAWLPQVQPPVPLPQIQTRRRVRSRVRPRRKKRDQLAWLPLTQPSPVFKLTSKRPKKQKRKTRSRRRDSLNWLPLVVPIPKFLAPLPKKKRVKTRGRKRPLRYPASLILPPTFVRFPAQFPRKRLRVRLRPRKRPKQRTNVAWFPAPPVIPPNVYTAPLPHTRFDGGVMLNGQLGAALVILSKSCARDVHFVEYSGPGTGVSASKVQKQHQKEYGQTAAVFAEQKVVHVVRGAVGSVIQFIAWAAGHPTGGDTVTVDLLKNGATILSAPITMNSSYVNYSLRTASIAITGLTAKDILEVKVTFAGGSGTRVGARVTLTEDPQ